MRRRHAARQVALTVLSAGLVVPLAFAGPAQAARQDPGGEQRPSIYHTIVSTHGSAVVDLTEGCVRAEVYVSASVGHYAAQPGPSTKQGLTGVLVRLTDVCAVSLAAAGGGPVLAEYDGQAMVPLQVDPRLTTASVVATMTDVDDPDVTITLDARWTGVGELEHTTAHNHVLFPGEGVVSSTANDLRRTADAVVTVDVTGPEGTLAAVTGATAAEAALEQTRSRCVEVPRPGVEGFYPCFGFPG